MKQFALLSTIFVLGSLGSLYHPFWSILLYYLLAVLRPQYIWKWALPFEWRWSLYAALIVLISLIFNSTKLVNKLRLNLVTGLMLVYGIWIIFSVVTAYDPSTAQNFGIDIGKILVMAVIASLIIDKMWHLRSIALMVMLTIGYIAWEINSLYLMQGRLDVFHYGYGGLDNNGAGLMLAMGIPFAYAFAVSAPRRWQRCVCGFVGIMILHALLMTYSRGAVVAVVCGLVWILFHHRSKLQSVFILLVLVVAVSLLAGQEIRDRFMSTTQYKTDHSAQSRFESWSAAWEIALDHPLTGIGVRNANRYSRNYGADVNNRTIHSQYLQIAADSGIPAMLIFLSMLGMSLFYFQKSRAMCRDQLQEDHSFPLSSRKRASLIMNDYVLLGYQSSLVIYAAGAFFLSLELFELPFLVMAVAGIAPYLVSESRLAQPTATQENHQPALAGISPVHAQHILMTQRQKPRNPAVRNLGQGLAEI